MVCLDVLAVLAAVHLDHQPSRMADEVQVIAVKRRLATDMEASVAEPSQAGPENDFGLAHVAAKFAGALDLGAHGRNKFLFCAFRNKFR